MFTLTQGLLVQWRRFLPRVRGWRGARLAGIAGMAAALLVAGEARGTHLTDWTGDSTSDWNDSGSWDHGVPTSSYQVYINTNSAPQPILGGETGFASNLYVGEDGSSGTSTLLTVNGGSVLTVSNSFTVGDQAGAIGAVSVEDSESELLFGADSYVGNSGNGTLSVSDGAMVDGGGNNLTLGAVFGSNGTVTMDVGHLIDLNLLDVGDAGNGTFTMQGGGNLSAASMTLGDMASGNGTAVVTGAATIANLTGFLVVGDSGTGSLTVNASAIWDNGGGGIDVADAAGSNGTIVVDGATFQNVNIFDLACCGNGSLSVLDGGSVSAGTLDIGVSMSANGTATVDGVGTFLNVSDNLIVGDGANGTLNVTGGGQVIVAGTDGNGVGVDIGNQAGSNGNVTVTGNVFSGFEAASELSASTGTVVVGDAGNGTLGVYDGGFVSAEGTDGNVGLYIGNQTGGVGNVTVSGVAADGFVSQLNVDTGALMVGNAGNGTLNITDGGLVDAEGSDSFGNGVIIGNQTGGNGTVMVSGVDGGSGSISTLEVDSGALVVGASGNGTLSILDGGNVAAADSVLLGLSGNGTVTVDAACGTGSALSVGNTLYVGVFGNGNLSITGGGNVSVASDVEMGEEAGGVGNVSVDSSGGLGSILNVGGELDVGNGGNGTLTITAGGNVSVGEDMDVGNDFGSNGTASIDGAASVLNIGGVLNVGNGGNGTLCITGNSMVTVLNGGSEDVGADIGAQAGSNGYVTVAGANACLDLSSELDVVMGALVVGDAGNGTLGIYAGGYVNSEGGDSNGVGVYIGNQSGSNGTVTISGYANTFDSEMDLNDALVVGNGGNGTLNIYHGGVVNVFGEDISQVGVYVGNQAGSNGNFTVDGVNATSHFSSELDNEQGAIMVGNAGNGSLTITRGGYVDAQGEDGSEIGVYVGNSGGSNGNISVSGVYIGVGSRSSELQVGEGAVVVGNYGNGTMNITDSGYVLAEGADENEVGVYVGNQTGSVGYVSVDGKNCASPYASELSITDGALVVGNAGNGTLSITNDGNVDVSGEDGSEVGAYVGNQTGSNGNITVSGLTSHTVYSELSVDEGTLIVGNAGNGSVEIDTGAYVDVEGEDDNDVSIYIGNQTGGNGNITLTGYVSPYSSEMDASGAIMVGNAGNGTLNILDGGRVDTYDSDVNGVGLYIGNQCGSVSSVTVDGMNATAGIDPALDVAEGAVVVGNYGNGTLSVTSGGNVDIERADDNEVGLYIGNQTGGVGNVTVDGVDGGAGNVSELTVDEGAAVVGNYGNGTLSVTAGAFVGAFGADSANVSVYIGNQAGSNGNVTVDGGVLAGPTQLFVQDDLVVGNGGNGSLDISNGGYVNVYGNDTAGVGVYIGDQSGSNGYVSVTGASLGNVSTLDVATGAGALVVGNSGNGTLDIGGGNGGVVTVSSFLILAGQGGSKGTVNLNTNGTLQVGGTNGIQAGAGCSSFNLLGGTVQVIGADLTTSVAAKLCAGTSFIDTNGWNATWSGALSGPGALKKIGAGTLTLTAASSYEGGTIVGMGKLVLTDVGGGSVLGTGPLNVEVGGTLAGNGRVDGDATISGTLSPGNCPGLITFGGNLTLNSCSFTNMELAGNATPGTDYDAVNVTGNLTTGGTLTVSLINGFSPSRGDSFDLFTVGGTITASFGQVNLPSLGGGLGWDTSQLYTVGDISVVPEPAAWGLALGAGIMAWAMWRRRGRRG